MAQTAFPSRSSNIPPYVKIDITGLGQQKIEFEDVSHWRNNLVAVSKRYNYLFIALQSCVYVYVPTYPSQACSTTPSYILRSDPIIPLTGYIDPRHPHAINSLTVGDLGFEEVLVSAHDDGDVCVWYTRDLSRIALRLSVGVSAWGVALHKEKRLLAVSANSHNITVFQLGIGEEERMAKKSREEDEQGADYDLEDRRQCERKKRRKGSAPGPTVVTAERTYASVLASATDVSSGRVGSPESTREDISSPYKKTLKGHQNNIPSISFLDEPSGRWLVGTSIDGVVIIWDIEAEKMVEKAKLGQLDRGWAVLFLTPECFKPVATIYEALGYPIRSEKFGKTGTDTVIERLRYGANGYPYNISPVFSETSYLPFEAFAIQHQVDYELWHPSSESDEEDEEREGEDSDGEDSNSEASDYSDINLLQQTLASDSEDSSVDFSIEEEDDDATMADTGRESEQESISSSPSDHEVMGDYPVPSSQWTDQSEAATSPGGFERRVISEFTGHSRNQQINNTPRRRARETVKPRAPSVPLENENEAEPPPLSFIFSTTEQNCQLLDSSGLSSLVLCQRALFSPQPANVFQYLGNIDRLNMVCTIPELSIVVAASQKGRAAIFRLTRFGNEFLMRMDCILPRETSGALGHGDGDHQYRPSAALLGIAVGPIQGREIGRSRRNSDDFSTSEERTPWGAGSMGSIPPTHGDGTYYRVGRKRSGWRGVEKQRRYRLMMVYTDSTVLSYELGRDPDGGSILKDGFLMV